MKFIRNATALSKISPILIGMSASIYNPMHATNFEYSEEALTNNIVGVSKDTAVYLDSFKGNTIGANLYLKYRFNLHYNNWKTETLFTSNVDEIINHDDFQSMVQIGNESITFILEKIESEPSTLVWALNIITGVKISNDSTITVKEACKKWVNWGKRNNLI